VEPQFPRRLRSFVQTPLGRTLLLAFTIVVVFGAFYLSVLFAIPAILIVGLWLPIYLGQKRPRYLALSGVVVLLLMAPLISIVYTGELLAPIGPASSAPAGTDWSVTIDGMTVDSQSPSIGFQLPTGNANYTVAPEAGYTATLTGHVAVGTSSVTVPVPFSAVKYPVTFTETGLPGATAWGVRVGSVSVSSSTATTVVQLPNGTYDWSLAPVRGYTPPIGAGTVGVAGGPVSVTVAYAHSAYPVTFSETGLPLGSTWSVTADSAIARSDTPHLVLDLPNGTTGFTAAGPAGYYTAPGGTVSIAGASVSQSVSFSQAKFAVTFNESQLPSSSLWSITVGDLVTNSTSGNIVVDLANGTFDYSVGGPHGYAPVVGQNTVRVAGVPETVPVVFNATPHVATFTETGLAAGSAWKVSVGPTTVRSTNGSIRLNLSDGSYPYAVSLEPGYTVVAAGTVVVSGSNVLTSVTYTPVKYLLTFSEVGLGSGTAWNVTIDGLTHNTRTAHVTYNVSNGTYPYRIGAPSGKSPPTVVGTVVVSGGAATVPVPFFATTYSVVFTESGLPAGAGAVVLANATVGPFHGSVTTQFTWTTTVDPRALPAQSSEPLWIALFLSTCPGATSNTSEVCSAGYAFIVLTHFFCADPSTIATCEATAPNLTGPTTVTFNYTIGANGIWAWQMGLAAEDLSSHSLTSTLLVGDATYNGLEGPVVGSWSDVYSFVLPSIYLEDFLYLGLPYFALLLLYVYFKRRQQRRDEARHRVAGPIPPTSGSEDGAAPSGGPVPSSGGSAPAPPGPAVGEESCPNCGAVVYPSESKCWKCGVSLGNAPAPPLPRSP